MLKFVKREAKTALSGEKKKKKKKKSESAKGAFGGKVAQPICARARSRALCRVMELRISITRYYLQEAQYMDRGRTASDGGICV